MFAPRYFTGSYFPRRYFPTGGTAVIPPVRGGGGGFYYQPGVYFEKRLKPKVLKRLLREVVLHDSDKAKQELEARARAATDAVDALHDLQKVVWDLEKEITTKARELEESYVWAQQMLERLQDERIILMLLLEEA